MIAPGAHPIRGGTRFAVRSPLADQVELCLFEQGKETRLPMERQGELWLAEVKGAGGGTRYGYRANGKWLPEQGQWFDLSKLLVDPYAIELDQRFVQSPRLAIFGEDTVEIVPKAIVPAPLPEVLHRSPQFERAGLIYELNVKGFTRLHPEVPENLKGTIAALAHPSCIAHFRKLHVSAVELMPIVAWIDERHLPPLGLCNTWGYNPVAMMALDPGLCPGGVAELRETVATLHAAGIGVILDIVLNHSGESDIHGGVLSLRGLDDSAYSRQPDGALINDTGCGNTLDFSQGWVRQLALDSLRHFVRHCGVDGFRFDLAPILARGPGFDVKAPFFAELARDPILADRVLIAEPWDIGPGGYQLGNFPRNWLEWNDRYRDDIRRFWRGDAPIADLATRIAGSSDCFGKTCRSVNFLAAHDGFTLADTVAYEERHNLANGEGNRDGHGENFSWNNGHEGPSDDALVNARRAADLRALLGTLFASTGTIMLTAGDEFGRSQQGNNNAYAQDNELSWIDWANRDMTLERHVAHLSAFRAERLRAFQSFPKDGQWTDLLDQPLSQDAWHSPDSQGLRFGIEGNRKSLSVEIDRGKRKVTITES